MRTIKMLDHKDIEMIILRHFAQEDKRVHRPRQLHTSSVLSVTGSRVADKRRGSTQ